MPIRMRVVPVTGSERGALVDDEDFDVVIKNKWHLNKDGYAQRCSRKVPRVTLMHRQILGVSRAEMVDHEDEDKLNNQRLNLRRCNKSQNGANRRHARKDSRNPYKGIKPVRGKWQARITVSGVRHHLGTFTTPEEASEAYRVAAVRMFGEFAPLNMRAA
jgi:hypothetical protein